MELAEGGQNIAFSDADIPKLSSHLGRAFLFLPNFGDKQDKSRVDIESV
jgi:hypothetical protein